MRLVVGLGNPGERYAATRHNVGWRVLDRLAARWEARRQIVPGVFELFRARPSGVEVELLRPLTYMNRAGVALDRWRMEHGTDPDEMLVVADDVYLPLGTLRLRASGSSGGHRGLESIEAVFGGPSFARLRVGVGEAESSAELKEHVLESFTPEEEPIVRDAVARAADAVACWALEGITPAMNRFNRRIRKEVPEP